MRNGRRVTLSKTERESFRGLRIFELGRRTNGPFKPLIVELDANTHLPEIYHRATHEFFYVIDGEAYGKVGRRRLRFKKGSSAYLPPGMTHDLHTGRTGVRALVIFAPGWDFAKPDVVKTCDDPASRRRSRRKG